MPMRPRSSRLVLSGDRKRLRPEKAGGIPATLALLSRLLAATTAIGPLQANRLCRSLPTTLSVVQVVVVAATPLVAAAEAALLEEGTLLTRPAPARALAPPDDIAQLLEGAAVAAEVAAAVVGEAGAIALRTTKANLGCLREGLGVTAELRRIPKTTTHAVTKTLGLEI